MDALIQRADDINWLYECITGDYRKGPEGYVASICPIVGALKRLLNQPWDKPLRL